MKCQFSPWSRSTPTAPQPCPASNFVPELAPEVTATYAMVERHMLTVICLVIWTCFSTTSAWILSTNPCAPVLAPKQHRRQSTTLSVKRKYKRDSGDDEDAAEAAREARESLERLWASSAIVDSSQGQDEDEDQLLREVREALPELHGERGDGDSAKELEVRREDPFPTSSERGALEAASAIQQALLAGKRGLLIDVEVRQLDDAHAEFDQDMLIAFVTDVSKAVARVCGRTKVMHRGLHLAERARETLEEANAEGEEVGIEPQRDITFCSFQMPNADDEEDDGKSLMKFASTLGLDDENERVFFVACPRRIEDVVVLKMVIAAARGRPVIVLNPRMTHAPFEMQAFETVYQLRQYSVQVAKTDPRKRLKPARLTRLKQSQQRIFSEPGHPVPRVLTTRAFPDDFKLYVDVDGKGFQLESTYETRPQPAVVTLMAQKKIREMQLQASTQQQRGFTKDRGVDDDDEDDFWDTINDDLKEGEKPFIVPPMPSAEEINARLRDD